MKRLLIIAIVAVMLISCATGTGDYPDPQQVVDTWATGLREKNLDRLMSAYWPEAEVVIKGEDGSEQVFSGLKEIKDLQRGTTDNPDIILDIWTQTAELKVKGDTAVCSIEVHTGDFIIINVLDLEKRDNRWGIIRQVLK